MIQAIIEAMKQEIAKYKLEVLQHYPKDLEIDMATLERFAHPGMKIAWMVGDSHTHIAPLGVHQKLNEIPTYLTRLANNDRFYVLSIGHGPAQFTLKEITRNEFSALVYTTIPYKSVGPVEAFWLYRNNARVGTCVLTREGTYEKPVYKISLTPMGGISQIDREALKEWGQQAVTSKSGSLFSYSQVEWMASIDMPLAA